MKEGLFPLEIAVYCLRYILTADVFCICVYTCSSRATKLMFVSFAQNVDFIANDCSASHIMHAFLLYFRKEKGMFSLRERDLVTFLCHFGSVNV